MIHRTEFQKVFLAVLLLCSFFARSQTPSNDKNWDLINLRLDENFNGSSLNTSLWQNGLGYNDLDKCSISNISVSYEGTKVTVTTYGSEGQLYEHKLIAGNKIAFNGIAGIIANPEINNTVFTINSVTTYTLTFYVSSISGTYTLGTGCIVQDNYFYDNIDNIFVSYTGNNVTVTTPYPHGLNTGNKVVFTKILGLNVVPNINSTLFTINSVTSNTLTFSVTSISGTYTPNTGSLYKTDNVYLDGSSNLILQSDFNAARPNNKTIHTGAITSVDHDYSYGYYEIRCKLNSNGKRYMPAFWVWGGAIIETCDTPDYYYNENDFFEAFLDPSTYNLSSNVHNFVVDCNTNNWGKIHDYRPENINFINEFHTFGYEWTPNKIIYYLDGVCYDYFYSQYVASHPLYLTVDLGIRNPWSAAPADLGTNSPDYKNFMTIDYIKVYNLKSSCIDETISNFNSGTYNNYSVKNKIIINGTSNVIAGDKVILRANDILISGDFTVPVNSELILLPTDCY